MRAYISRKAPITVVVSVRLHVEVQLAQDISVNFNIGVA